MFLSNFGNCCFSFLLKRSGINLLEANPPLNHRCDVTGGVLREECLGLLQSFFREAREKKAARLAAMAGSDGNGNPSGSEAEG